VSDQKNTVECATHGTSTATYVCQHLTKGNQHGFHCGYDSQEPDELWPDAWCDDCEKVLKAEGEWNDESAAKADIQVVCSSCYEGLRENHWKQDNEKFNLYLNSCNKYLKKKQDKFLTNYKINNHESWECFQETGKLVFTHNGKPQVEARISYSGSYSTESNTWLWAWANESLVESIKSKSRALRKIGMDQNVIKLASARWSAVEDDGWEMTAIMAKECKAIGTYRTSDKDSFTYMIVHEAKWLDKQNQPNLIKTFINKFK
jgi:hypothetical protein